MATEKAVTKKEESLPATFNEVSNMAKAFVQSGYFSDTKQLAQAIVKIQAGKELGLPPVYSMQNINLIRDRLTSSANTMAMLVKKSGRYNYRVKEHTDLKCSITFHELDGDKWIEVGESTFTMEDAKRANLVKPDSGWVKYPRAMLFSRAISQGARMYAPDAIGGIYTDEEIRSIPPKPDDTVKITEEINEPEPVAEEIPPTEATKPPKVEPEPSQESNIDLDWLRKAVKTLQDAGEKAYSDENLLSYMKVSYKVEGTDIYDIASTLKEGQVSHFTQMIQRGLDKLGS